MTAGDPVIQSLIFILVTCALAFAVRFINSNTRIELPYTLVMFVAGLGLALFFESGRTGEFGSAMGYASYANPSVLMLLVLPPAIFSGALNTNVYAFYKSFSSSMALAFPALVVSAALTAVVIKTCFVSMNFTWASALMLASILGATDPVAVVDSIRALGAPARLAALIEAESMLNDGSAYVFFVLFRDIVTGKDHTVGTGIGTFLRLAVGGPLLGVAVYILTYSAVKRLHFDAAAELMLVVVAVFATFLLAEHVLFVSSILATVTFGLLMSVRGQYGVTAKYAEAHKTLWDLLSFMSTGIIFSLAGVIVLELVVHSSNFRSGKAWGYLLLLVISLVVFRFVATGLFYPMLSRVGYKMNFREFIYVSVVGLRGGIALVLAIVLTNTPGVAKSLKEDCAFLVAGSVLLTTLILGGLGGWLYRKLDMFKLSESDAAFFAMARSSFAETSAIEMAQLRTDWLFTYVDMEFVTDLVPNFASADFAGYFKAPVDMLPMKTCLRKFYRRSALALIQVAPIDAALDQSPLFRSGAREQRVAQDEHAEQQGSADLVSSPSPSCSSLLSTAPEADDVQGTGTHASSTSYSSHITSRPSGGMDLRAQPSVWAKMLNLDPAASTAANLALARTMSLQLDRADANRIRFHSLTLGIVRSYFASLRSRFLQQFERGDIAADAVSLLVALAEKHLDNHSEANSFLHAIERFFKEAQRLAMLPRWLSWVKPLSLQAWLRRTYIRQSVHIVWAISQASHEVLSDSLAFEHLSAAEREDVYLLSRRLARMMDVLFFEDGPGLQLVISCELARRVISRMHALLDRIVDSGELTSSIAKAAQHFLTHRLHQFN